MTVASPSLRALAWPALVAFWLLGSAWMLQADLARWDWQPALAAHQPWRAWTAALVHWSGRHAAMNAGAAVLVGWLGWRAGAGPAETLAWLLAWPLTQAGLLLQPGLLHYAGLSGVLHAGVVIIAWHLWRTGPGRARRVALLLAAGLLIKLLGEAPWAGAVHRVPGWDFELAPMGHVSGTLAGALCAWLCLRAPERRKRNQDE